MRISNLQHFIFIPFPSTFQISKIEKKQSRNKITNAFIFKFKTQLGIIFVDFAKLCETTLHIVQIFVQWQCNTMPILKYIQHFSAIVLHQKSKGFYRVYVYRYSSEENTLRKFIQTSYIKHFWIFAS